MKARLGMRHAVLWVSDPDRSAEFYGQALGLEVANRLSGESWQMRALLKKARLPRLAKALSA